MADDARKYTDDELKAMEKYLSDIYRQAEIDLKKKFNKYMADFARLEADKKKMVESGEMSQGEFDEWRKNKLLYGTHWPKLIKQVQKEMSRCNQTAIDYVNGKVPQIFAVNYNQLAEVISGSPVGGYSYELINADTVRNIATSDGIMLPPPRKGLNIPKDEQWNAKLVNAQLLQGILQGESIPKMAARMANVCNSNKAAATRTARTMTTAAENSGRQSGINRATADGIILIKEWLATNDERTRNSHAQINHERVRCDAGSEKVKKFSNGLAFPGDWNGKPAEVYNCRCTLITKYAGVDRKLLKKAVKRQTEVYKGSPNGDNKPYKNDEMSEENQNSLNDMIKRMSSTDDIYNKILAKLFTRNVEYRAVKPLERKLTEAEIIKKLSDKDDEGCCASLALAYIGQKNGLNVTDFRGGKSRELFAKTGVLYEISQMQGMSVITADGDTEMTHAANLLKKCVPGKEYLLSAGKHVAIVKKVDGKLKYLELQESVGEWCDFENNINQTLALRFRCARTVADSLTTDEDYMLDIEASTFGREFRILLGYLNTADD